VTIRELEIIKAALEGDIIRQKEFDKRHHPAFKEWLNDSEKLLRKVSVKLFTAKAKQQMINQLK
jgi:hypothetical protein